MASLGKANGVWRVQLICPDQKRRAVHLPKTLSKKQARNVVSWIERLADTARSGQPNDPETAAWLGRIDDSLYGKLVRCGLVQARENSRKVSISVLAEFVTDYIASRVSVKSGTRKRWETVKGHLIKFFGESKPVTEVTLRDADLFAEYLTSLKLAENTKRRYLGIAKQFFNSAVRGKVIEENPFRDQKTSINGNQEKNRFFVTSAMSKQILETCPDTEWRLIFALMRYGGLRCPTEVQALRWCDVNWDQDRLLVHSIKTEHIDGRQTRWCPIFPEIRPFLEECFAEADEGAEFVLSKRRSMTHRGLIAQYERILFHAGVPRYPKLFQNLRSTRQTELADEWPLHKVIAWIGNSRDVALKHYLQVTDEDFRQAARGKSEIVAAQQAETNSLTNSAHVGTERN